MQLPFVTRKRYEADRGIIAYLPQENQNPSAGTNLAYHDKRIGWVEPKQFKTYDDYLAYLRKEREATK